MDGCSYPCLLKEDKEAFIHIAGLYCPSGKSQCYLLVEGSPSVITHHTVDLSKSHLGSITFSTIWDYFYFILYYFHFWNGLFLQFFSIHRFIVRISVFTLILHNWDLVFVTSGLTPFPLGIGLHSMGFDQ